MVPFGFILLAASDRAEEGIISELVLACNCQNFLKPSSTEACGLIVDESASEDTSPGPMQSHLFCSILCFGHMHIREVVGCGSWGVTKAGGEAVLLLLPPGHGSLGACGPVGQSPASGGLPAAKGPGSCLPALPTVPF